MESKELYQKKVQALLDEWKADVDKLKAKAQGASAEAQIEWNKQIEFLEGKMKEGKAKLSELANTGEEAWDSIKDGVESAWDSMKSAFRDALDKIKK